MEEAIITLLLNTGYQVAILFLISFGLAIVMGLLGILNMAHGEFVTIGAYSAYIIQSMGLPFFTAIPVAFIICSLVGFVLERTIIRHLYDRPFDSLLATWGIAILIREILELIFGKGYKSLSIPYEGSIKLGSYTSYPTYRIIVFTFIISMLFVLFYWYKNSRAANRVRAVIANKELAGIIGINVKKIKTITFVIGVGSAGVAGVIISPLVRVDPFMGVDYLLNSFFALVVGGMGSLLGLIVGVTFIGGIQNIFSYYANQTISYFIVLALCIIFMRWRTNGIISRS